MAHRYITNLLLSHVCDAWNISMPAKTSSTFGSYGSIAGVQRRYNDWANSYHNSGWSSGDQFRGTYSDSKDFTNDWPDNSWRYNGPLVGNNSNEIHRAWNRPCDLQAQHRWDGFNNNSSSLSGMTFSSLQGNFYLGTNSLGPVLNQAQKFQWQSYEESSYNAHAPNRRYARRHANPYSRY